MKSFYQCIICKEKTPHTFGENKFGWMIIKGIEFTGKEGTPIIKDFPFSICSKRCFLKWLNFLYGDAEVIELRKEK